MHAILKFKQKLRQDFLPLYANLLRPGSSKGKRLPKTTMTTLQEYRLQQESYLL
jgi:hypothetical protein